MENITLYKNDFLSSTLDYVSQALLHHDEKSETALLKSTQHRVFFPVASLFESIGVQELSSSQGRPGGVVAFHNCSFFVKYTSRILFKVSTLLFKCINNMQLGLPASIQGSFIHSFVRLVDTTKC